jgi:aryl-phospho-beta-D-glucosidase BglC (GH1 family)
MIGSSGGISYDWLRTNGKWIVDSQGNIVILRGVNVHDVLYQPRTEDYKRIASWGFNVVRLPIAWHNIETIRGFYDVSYLESIDREIRLAKMYGIHVILAMHQYHWSPYFNFSGQEGYGMPMWVVGGYANNLEGFNQAITDFWIGKGPNGTEASEANPSMQELYINVWKFVVERYKLDSTVAIFELFNEPYHSSYIDPCLMPKYLFPFYCRIIETIRTADSRHIISYEPTGGWDSGRAQKLNFSNLAFTFHYYGRDIYDGNSTALRDGFMYRYNPPCDWQSKPSAWNIPIYLGEFGTDAGPYNPNASKYVRDYRQILDDEVRIGWMWWIYGRSDTRGYELLHESGEEKVELVPYLRIT